MIRNKIIKYLIKVLSKHKTAKDNLIFRFVTDNAEHRYYGFQGKPPPERYKAILRHHDMLTVGLSENNYLRSIKTVIDCLKNGITDAQEKKKNKDMVKAFALLFEMEARAGEPSYDSILEILALTLVRSDEDPKTINIRIHNEKKEYLNNVLESNPSRIEKLPEYALFYDSGLGGAMINEMQKNSQLSNDQIESILKY